MQTNTGVIQETVWRADGLRTAWIACSPTSLPEPGQYLSAWSLEDPFAPLATILFAGEVFEDRFLALPPLPADWQPGMHLALRGPLGRGFSLPEAARHIALAAWGDTCERLIPLARQALQSGGAVALFTDARLPVLPPAMEANPLSTLAEAVPWADYLAVEVDRSALPQLRSNLGLRPGERLAYPAQALYLVEMPCAGLAACGACWAPSRRSILYACSDGPVFSLDDLDW